MVETETQNEAAVSRQSGERTCTPAVPMAELNRQAQRLEALIEKAHQLSDLSARALLQEMLESVLSFYGEGLSRVLQVTQEAEAKGESAFDHLVHDPGVSGLLLVHGLHPVDLETRARNALEKIRPYMESHGGNVELLNLQNGVARLRLQGTCKSCPSSSVTLELAVRKALEEACPDLAGFEVV